MAAMHIHTDQLVINALKILSDIVIRFMDIIKTLKNIYRTALEIKRKVTYRCEEGQGLDRARVFYGKGQGQNTA